MTTQIPDSWQVLEPLPVEDEAATIAMLATVDERGEGFSDEQHAKSIAAAREEAESRGAEMWAGDTRRALYGMATAGRRLHAEIKADEDYLSMLADEILRRNAPKLAQAKWLEEQVTEHAEELLPTGSRAGKFVDLPGVCRVQYVDRKRTVRIADTEAFMDWARQRQPRYLIEIREHLRVQRAKEVAMGALEDSGELLPGVEDVPERRTASIKWEGVS